MDELEQKIYAFNETLNRYYIKINAKIVELNERLHENNKQQSNGIQSINDTASSISSISLPISNAEDNKQFIELQEEINVLKDKIANKSTAIKNQADVIDKLTKLKDNAFSANKDFYKEYQSMQIQYKMALDKLQTDNNELLDNMKKLEETHQELITEKDKLIHELHEQNINVKGQLASNEQSIIDIKSQITRLQVRIRENEGKIDELTTLNQQLTSKNVELNTAIATIEQQYKQNMEDLKNTNDTLLSKIGELTNTVDLSKQENTELVKQLNNLREQLRILNRQVANQQQLISENDDLKTQLQKLTDDNRGCEEKLARLRRELDEKTIENQRLQEENTELQNTIERQQSQRQLIKREEQEVEPEGEPEPELGVPYEKDGKYFIKLKYINKAGEENINEIEYDNEKKTPKEVDCNQDNTISKITWERVGDKEFRKTVKTCKPFSKTAPAKYTYKYGGQKYTKKNNKRKHK